MRKLLSLKNVYDSTDIKSLNNLFDAIETQVCSFNDLDYILANKTRRPYRFFFRLNQLHRYLHIHFTNYHLRKLI